MAKANFTVDATSERGFVLLEDLGTGMTISNDAARVVRWLAEAGVLEGPRRVLYRDTSGVWDELLHKDGRFVDFAPVGAHSRAEAVQTARRRVLSHGRER
jgi:hypothetical protein